jgi:formate C-acetyltransferase
LSHIAGQENGRGGKYLPAFYPHEINRSLGIRTKATPDGRHAGEPLSRQMNMASLPVLTAAANSMAALTEADFNDVGMFDFALPYVLSDNGNFHKAVTDYVLVCLKLKIPVLQSNMSNPTLLMEERDHKGTHPDLVVRVCGYSALFTELSRDMQDEIIERLGTQF